MIKKYLSAALVILVGFSSFLGFKPFFEGITDNVAQQFISATFGSIFASILTMFLLNQQTEIEERAQKNQKVFDEKVTLFKEIINALNDIFEDKKITNQELSKLEFILIRLTMLASDRTIEKFKDLYQYFLSDERNRDDEGNIVLHSLEILDKNKHNILLDFTSQCRLELGLSENMISESLFVSINQTIAKSEKLKKNYLEDWDELVSRLECSEEEKREVARLLITLMEIADVAYRYTFFEFDVSYIEASIDEIANPELRKNLGYIMRYLSSEPARDLLEKEILLSKVRGKKLLEKILVKETVVNLIDNNQASRGNLREHLLNYFGEFKESDFMNSKIDEYLDKRNTLDNEFCMNLFKEKKYFSTDLQILDSLLKMNDEEFQEFAAHSNSDLIACALKFANPDITERFLALNNKYNTFYLMKDIKDCNCSVEAAIEMQKKILT